MFSKLVNYFKKNDPVRDYHYDTLPLEKIAFLHKDIVEYTDVLNGYLKIGLTSEELVVKTIRTSTYNLLYIKDWCVDNDRYLNDLNLSITEFISTTDKFILEFNKLMAMNKTDTLFFNTGRLQPYIINIESIRGWVK